MSDTEAKNKPASRRKLSKEREKGNVAQAAEVSGLVSSGLSAVFTAGMIVLIFAQLAGNFTVVEQGLDIPFVHAFDRAKAQIGLQLLLAVGPIVLISTATSILTSIIYNKGIPFSLNPITPQINRISPVAGFKRMFQKRSLIETCSGIMRLTIWFALATLIIGLLFREILNLHYCGAPCSVQMAYTVALRLILAAIILFLICAGFEMIIQKSIFLSEQKMTESEVKKEMKDQMGSTEIRQERRRLQRETVDSSDASSVDHANMCFFWEDKCIAVRYHPQLASTPRVTAKGRTPEKSQQIRAQIRANGFSELEHRDIVEKAIGTQIGNPIGSKAHEALLDGLKVLFT